MVIAAIAIAVLIALARSGLLGMSLQGTTLSAVAPVADVLALPARVLTRVWAGLVRTRDVARENTLLQERVAELERDLNAERERAARARELEAMVKLQQESPSPLLVARVVIRDDLPWSKSIVIDRGSRDGVLANMAVVSGPGLVGKVTEVGYSYSRVLLTTDRNFKAGARLRMSRQTGVAEGQGTAAVLVNYLPRDAAAAPEEDVITSGMGGTFPPGLLIGHVRQLAFDRYGFYQYATVTPAVNFNALELVAVVLRQPPKFDVTTEDAE